jgi:signal transduction histidine kinase
VIAGRYSEEDEIHADVMPLSLADEMDCLGQVDSAWWPTTMLPHTLMDRLSGVIGNATAWCCPIRRQDRVWGGIVVAGDAPPEEPESYTAFSDAVGAWLNCAESATNARQLNEELVEINSRLVASQAEVARMRSLSMVGAMAAGAAHELNNPLAVISGRAQLLMKTENGEEVHKAASVIAENAHRASEMVSGLMEFAKPATPRPTDISPAELLAELRRSWIEKGEIAEKQFEIRLSDDLPRIRADGSQTRTLFDEVIRNAVDAMRGVSEPLLRVNCTDRVADDRIVIEVTDNGCGMTPDVVEEAMTPFFSYRPAGRGRGLGLSRAARYAEINGGRIRLASEPGRGTVVSIELPIAR